MNLNKYFEQIIGLKVLNIAHLLNLTGFVFGACSPEEQVLENSYGLQLACPWVLKCQENAKILAASGDFFANPEDLKKVKDEISEWQTNYTYLDENLEMVLQEDLYVEKIEISNYGDLKVFFSKQIVLCTFTDFSEEQYGWWFYKCGGAYLAPLQKGNFVENIITPSETWWLLKSKGRNIYISDDNSATMEKLQTKQEYEYILDEKSLSYWSQLTGGELIEIGRKKEEALKEAPVAWLKFRVADEKNDNRVFVIYFYCPWRIYDKKNSEILIATSDIRGILCWDDMLQPSLRENDYYKDKNEAVHSLKLKVMGASLSKNGNLILKFGEQYYFEAFFSQSADATFWRGYHLTNPEYYEGGKDFLDYHQKHIIKESNCDFASINQYLSEIAGAGLLSITRKGTYYAFTFSKDKESGATGQKYDLAQLICGQQWRLVDLKTQNVIVGGRDCYLPCTQYKDVDNINWLDTINTKYDERCAALMNREKLCVTGVNVNKQGDLQIHFTNDVILECFVHSSFALEEWQIRGFNGTRLRVYGNMVELVHESDTENKRFMDTITIEPEEIPFTEKLEESQSVHDVKIALNKRNDFYALNGKRWSPEMLEELKLPWRLCDQNHGDIILGTGDLCFPGEKTEWVDFFEEDKGGSLFDDKWEQIKDTNLVVKDVKYYPNGDVTIFLAKGVSLEIFNNLGEPQYKLS